MHLQDKKNFLPSSTTGEVVPAPGLSFCQSTDLINHFPSQYGTEDMNNISSKKRGEGRSCLSAHHCKISGFHLWRTVWRTLCSLCLRRVLGKLSVIRKLQVKSNTKCVCLAVSEDRRHRLDCAESCKVAGYRKRFFDLGSFLVQIQGLFLLTRCWWRWLKNMQVLT